MTHIYQEMKAALKRWDTIYMTHGGPTSALSQLNSENVSNLIRANLLSCPLPELEILLRKQ